MFVIPVHFIFGGHLSFLLFVIGKIGTNKNQQFMPQKGIKAEDKKHESFQAGFIIKRSIS